MQRKYSQPPSLTSTPRLHRNTLNLEESMSKISPIMPLPLVKRKTTFLIPVETKGPCLKKKARSLIPTFAESKLPFENPNKMSVGLVSVGINGVTNQASRLSQVNPENNLKTHRDTIAGVGINGVTNHASRLSQVNPENNFKKSTDCTAEVKSLVEANRTSKVNDIMNVQPVFKINTETSTSGGCTGNEIVEQSDNHILKSGGTPPVWQLPTHPKKSMSLKRKSSVAQVGRKTAVCKDPSTQKIEEGLFEDVEGLSPLETSYPKNRRKTYVLKGNKKTSDSSTGNKLSMERKTVPNHELDGNVLSSSVPVLAQENSCQNNTKVNGKVSNDEKQVINTNHETKSCGKTNEENISGSSSCSKKSIGTADTVKDVIEYVIDNLSVKMKSKDSVESPTSSTHLQNNQNHTFVQSASEMHESNPVMPMPSEENVKILKTRMKKLSSDRIKSSAEKRSDEKNVQEALTIEHSKEILRQQKVTKNIVTDENNQVKKPRGRPKKITTTENLDPHSKKETNKVRPVVVSEKLTKEKDKPRKCKTKEKVKKVTSEATINPNKLEEVKDTDSSETHIVLKPSKKVNNNDEKPTKSTNKNKSKLQNNSVKNTENINVDKVENNIEDSANELMSKTAVDVEEPQITTTKSHKRAVNVNSRRKKEAVKPSVVEVCTSNVPVLDEIVPDAALPNATIKINQINVDGRHYSTKSASKKSVVNTIQEEIQGKTIVKQGRNKSLPKGNKNEEQAVNKTKTVENIVQDDGCVTSNVTYTTRMKRKCTMINPKEPENKKTKQNGHSTKHQPAESTKTFSAAVGPDVATERQSSHQTEGPHHLFYINGCFGYKQSKISEKPGILTEIFLHIDAYVMTGGITMETGASISKVTTNTTYFVTQGVATVKIDDVSKTVTAGEQNCSFFIPKSSSFLIINDNPEPLKMLFTKFKG